jgi:hypothetical protein
MASPPFDFTARPTLPLKAAVVDHHTAIISLSNIPHTTERPHGSPPMSPHHKPLSSPRWTTDPRNRSTPFPIQKQLPQPKKMEHLHLSPWIFNKSRSSQYTFTPRTLSFMCHPFRTYMFHMRHACEACRFEIVPFWTASE